jgi:hypothetical protein
MRKLIIILLVLVAFKATAQRQGDTTLNNPNPQAYTFQTVYKAIRLKALENNAKVDIDDHSDIRGGHFVVHDTAEGFRDDSAIVIKVPGTTKVIVRDASNSINLDPAWWGIGNDGTTDYTEPMQRLFDYAVNHGYNIAFKYRGTYKCNVILKGKFNIDFNYANFIPARNRAVITLQKRSNPNELRNLTINCSSISRDSTLVDGIYVDALGTSLAADYTKLTNVYITATPGYGVYAGGSGFNPHFIQRLYGDNCHFANTGLAAVRIEGVVAESGFVNSFFNGCNALGANPEYTNQTFRAQSPSREYRRGCIELLTWYDTTNTGNTSKTAGRFLLDHCNIVPSIAWYNASNPSNDTGRIAGVYISGGIMTSITHCNFEYPHPAIVLDREDGTFIDGNYAASSHGAIITNNNFYALHSNVGLPYPMIVFNGLRQTTIHDNYFRGEGNPEINGIIRQSWNGGLRTSGPLDVELNNSIYGLTFKTAAGYKGTSVQWDTTKSYTHTLSIPNCNCFSVAFNGTRMRVGLTNPGQRIDAIYSDQGQADFVDGQEVTIQPLVNVNGTMKVNHNTRDSSGNPVSGRLILKDTISPTFLTADWQEIRFKYSSDDSSFHEQYRNFYNNIPMAYYGYMVNIDTLNLAPGTYAVDSRTVRGTLPSTYGSSAIGSLRINVVSNNGLFSSTSPSFHGLAYELTRLSDGKTFKRTRLAGAFTAWDSIPRTSDLNNLYQTKLAYPNLTKRYLNGYGDFPQLNTDSIIEGNNKFVQSITLATPNVLYSTPITFTDVSGAWASTLTLNSQTANKVFASPDGTSGTPAFRALTPTDIPLSLTTTGTSGAATYSGGVLNIPNYSSGVGAYLPLAGGTMTGDINSNSIIPNTHNTYTLGSASKAWSTIYTSQLTSLGQLGLRSNSSSSPIVFQQSTTTVGQFAVTTANLVVGTGNTDVASALGNFGSTTKGFLIPRMTGTQRDAISSPATGLAIYNTTTNTNDYYNGSAWVNNGISHVNITTSSATVANVVGNETIVFVNYTGGTATITFPSASANTDKKITIKDLTTNNVTIVGTWATDPVTIGASSYGSYTYASDGTTWYMVGKM